MRNETAHQYAIRRSRETGVVYNVYEMQCDVWDQHVTEAHPFGAHHRQAFIEAHRPESFTETTYRNGRKGAVKTHTLRK